MNMISEFSAWYRTSPVQKIWQDHDASCRAHLAEWSEKACRFNAGNDSKTALSMSSQASTLSSSRAHWRNTVLWQDHPDQCEVFLVHALTQTGRGLITNNPPIDLKLQVKEYQDYGLPLIKLGIDFNWIFDSAIISSTCSDVPSISFQFLPESVRFLYSK